MKNITLVSLLLLLLGNQTGWAQKEISIMTFNVPTTYVKIPIITYLTGLLYRPKERQIRFDLAVDLIETYQPDIIGLQEGMANMKDFRKKLGGYTQATGNKNAIFYKECTLSVLEHGEFWLHPEGKDEKAWDAAFARSCVWVKFIKNDTKELFWVFNTHLDHKGKEARKQGALLIAQEMKERTGDDIGFLIGDLNSYSWSQPVIQLLALPWNFKDTKTLAQEKSGPIATFSGWEVTTEPSIHPSLVGRQAIDHVLVNVPVDVSTYEVIDFVKDEQRPSDHRPVMVEVSLEKSV